MQQEKPLVDLHYPIEQQQGEEPQKEIHQQLIQDQYEEPQEEIHQQQPIQQPQEENHEHPIQQQQEEGIHEQPSQQQQEEPQEEIHQQQPIQQQQEENHEQPIQQQQEEEIHQQQPSQQQQEEEEIHEQQRERREEGKDASAQGYEGEVARAAEGAEIVDLTRQRKAALEDVEDLTTDDARVEDDVSLPHQEKEKPREPLLEQKEQQRDKVDVFGDETFIPAGANGNADFFLGGCVTDKRMFKCATCPVYLNARLATSTRKIIFGDVFKDGNEIKAILGYVLHNDGLADVHLYTYNADTFLYADEVMNVHLLLEKCANNSNIVWSTVVTNSEFEVKKKFKMKVL
jgi:hypothetical protein